MPKKRRNNRITNYKLRIKNENSQAASQNQIDDKLISKTEKKAKKLSIRGGSALGRKVKDSTAAKVENFQPESQPPKVKADDEKTAEQKRLYMWVGVSGLMIIIITAWFFTLKYEFKASLKKSARSEFNWEETRAELNKTMTQVKQGLAEIKKIQAAESQKASSPESKPTQEQINLLKGKLLDEVASSTIDNKLEIRNPKL